MNIMALYLEQSKSKNDIEKGGLQITLQTD